MNAGIADANAVDAIGGMAAEVLPPGVWVWWLGQHGFALRIGRMRLYVDPFLSPLAGRTVPPVLEPVDLAHADLVLGSHDHADHIDRPAWPAIAAAAPRCRFVLPECVRESVAGATGVPLDRLTGLDAGQTLDLGDVRITGVAAAHEFLDRDAVSGCYPYLGFVIESGGYTLYHAGDTCLYEGLLTALRAWRFDAVFLPINGRDARRLSAGCLGNMTYQEAADLAGALAPGLTVPAHYEMFRGNRASPAAFKAYMRVKYPGLPVHIPRHGRCFRIVKAPL